MDFIKKIFKKDTILLFYRCGSYAFETADENSDEDYVVVLKDFNGITHKANGKKEYFIFGYDEWLEKQNFSDEYDSYFEIFNDEVLAFPNSIIYMDKSIEEAVINAKGNFKNNYKIWLKKVVEYFESYLKLNTINKTMYHLIRIRNIIENYKATGSFSLELSSKTKDWIKQFKESKEKRKYENDIKEALIYLKNEGGNE